MMKNALLAFMTLVIFGACANENPADKPEKSLEEITSASKFFNVPQSSVKEKKEKEIPKDTVNVAKIAFEEEAFDFGTVEEGDKVEYIYQFKNVGKVPLTITKARSTCGCTVPAWPKEPIGVGDKGEIKVVFNTAGKKGVQEKPIMVTANTWPTVTTVKLKGAVTPKEKQALEVADSKK